MMDAREPSYAYPEDDLDDRDYERRRRSRRDAPPPEDTPPVGGGGGAGTASATPYPEDESLFPGDHSIYAGYHDRPPSVYARDRPRSPAINPDYYRSPWDQMPPPDAYRSSRDRFPDDIPVRRDLEPGEPRESGQEGKDEPPPPSPIDGEKLKFLPQKYAPASSSAPPEGETRDEDDEKSRRYRYRAGEDDRDERDKDNKDKENEDDKDDKKRNEGKGDQEDADETSEKERERERDRVRERERIRRERYAEADHRERERERDREREGEPDRETSRRDAYLGDDHREMRRERRTSRARSPRPESPSGRYQHDEPKAYEYAKMDDRDRLRYDYEPRGDRPPVPPVTYGSGHYDDAFRPRRDRDASPNPAIREPSAEPPAEPPAERPRETPPRILTVEPGGDRRGSRRTRSRSPLPPTERMSSLSVSNPHGPIASSLSAAPGSPLLEAYRGTYQDMSPMPSPLLMASNSGSQVAEPLSPLHSEDERGTKPSRRARFHDPEDYALRLANALKGAKRDAPPKTAPLIEILPGLTHDQIMELRTEYRALVKTGPKRKGVNLAKHIRARLKDSDPHLMKACYATALGRWESEAYWANFWYQGDKTRRELLIESLMGRTNDEIRQIKDAFTDRKYDNSLTNCMRTELKEDKFKKAVLFVLDERRMDELDPYGRPMPLDYRLVDQDVDDLRRAIKAERGGESLMISIVVQRSDTHLREILKTYEHLYRSNFARDALKKSGNLVVCFSIVMIYDSPPFFMLFSPKLYT